MSDITVFTALDQPQRGALQYTHFVFSSSVTWTAINNTPPRPRKFLIIYLFGLFSHIVYIYLGCVNRHVCGNGSAPARHSICHIVQNVAFLLDVLCVLFAFALLDCKRYTQNVM